MAATASQQAGNAPEGQERTATISTTPVSYAELLENPLMLTMMLSVFRRMGGQLPERRSELYETALDSMLNRADASRRNERGVGKEDSADADRRIRKVV